MKGTTPYLHFNGNCRAAINLYSRCFGGQFEVSPYPDASGAPNPDPQARIMHSQFSRNGNVLLMASDYPPGAEDATLGNNFSVFIACSDNDELQELFSALSAGGKVVAAPCDMPFGRFAMCEDPFGVSWIFNVNPAA